MAHEINSGSPFVCHLVKSKSVSVSGPGLERIPVGQVAEIYVVVEGMKDALPQIRIIDSQGNNLPVGMSKSDAEDKKYIISYTPKNVGNHQVSNVSSTQMFQCSTSFLSYIVLTGGVVKEKRLVHCSSPLE